MHARFAMTADPADRNRSMEALAAVDVDDLPAGLRPNYHTLRANAGLR